MSTKTKVEGVQARLNNSEKTLSDFKDKNHRLRQILAGHPQALIQKGAADDENERGEGSKRSNPTERSDIFVKDIEEGRSNKLLRAIRTLGQQTTYQFPEIEAEHLDYEEANLHAEYFRQRLGAPPLGCNAVIQMRRALYDYAAGGMGWVWIGMQAGKPVVRYCDTLDCKWDQQATTLAEGLWWSTTMYSSLASWQQMFPKCDFSKYIKTKKATPNTPVELEYYYDIEGDQGSWMVLFRTGENDVDMSPVYEGPNPCFWDYGGQKVPYLPAECMFFMELPSARHPIGLVEQMLPSQIALWRVEKAIKRIMDNPSFYEYDEDAFDPKALQNFENGKSGSFLPRKPGKGGMEQRPPMVIPPSHIDYRAEHDQELVAQSGANPYAAGSPVEGTSYAAEVNAIQGASGLMAGTISKENADFWLRMLRKFLAKGSQFDDWPLVVRHEDVALVFDESDPIRNYLRPDTKLTIREDSMQFVDQQTKIALAKGKLEMALAVNTATQGAHINSVQEIYQDYLVATGENNLDKHRPVQVQAPAPVTPAQ